MCNSGQIHETACFYNCRQRTIEQANKPHEMSIRQHSTVADEAGSRVLLRGNSLEIHPIPKLLILLLLSKSLS